MRPLLPLPFRRSPSHKRNSCLFLKAASPPSNVCACSFTSFDVARAVTITALLCVFFRSWCFMIHHVASNVMWSGRSVRLSSTGFLSFLFHFTSFLILYSLFCILTSLYSRTQFARSVCVLYHGELVTVPLCQGTPARLSAHAHRIPHQILLFNPHIRSVGC